MRTWGRVTDPITGVRTWKIVTPTARGYPAPVYLTALIQTLLLNYGESPFYGDWGLPAVQSVLTQIFPDYWVTLTQQRYAQNFIYLGVKKEDSTTPTYDIQVIYQDGQSEGASICPFGDPCVGTSGQVIPY